MMNRLRGLLHCLTEIQGCGLGHLAPRPRALDRKGDALTQIRNAVDDARRILAVVPENHVHPLLDTARATLAELERELPALERAAELARDEREKKARAEAARPPPVTLTAAEERKELLAQARELGIAAEETTKRPKSKAAAS